MKNAVRSKKKTSFPRQGDIKPVEVFNCSAYFFLLMQPEIAACGMVLPRSSTSMTSSRNRPPHPQPHPAQTCSEARLFIDSLAGLC